MNEKVLKHLMEAFAGESQANRKYTAYAKQAEKEGFPNVAKLFRTSAEAETIHALAQLKIAGKIGNTIENLQDGVSGETYEYQEMYPPFIEDAKTAEEKEAVRIFTFAAAAEEVHARLYQEALEKVKAGEDIQGEYYLCPVCGNIEKVVPDNCVICNVKGSLFVKGN